MKLNFEFCGILCLIALYSTVLFASVSLMTYGNYSVAIILRKLCAVRKTSGLFVPYVAGREQVMHLLQTIDLIGSETHRLTIWKAR